VGIRVGEGREAQREEREKSGEVVAVAVAMAAGGRSSNASRARADGRYLIRAAEQGMKAEGGIAPSTRQHGIRKIEREVESERETGTHVVCAF
jgi:hypothetical protein